MGKINNSGKTAMFCDGVRISYYDKYLFETDIVNYLKTNNELYTDNIQYISFGAQIVIQKVNKYHVLQKFFIIIIYI